jgi:beta-xylosidase
LSFDLQNEAYSLALEASASSGCLEAQRPDTAIAAAPVRTTPTLDKLVLPGDFPDPTICKIGDTYWASATSAEWGPIFPLLKSTNLVDWELVSHVFPDDMPEWAGSSFWAPEIFYDNGRTYIYYTARQKGPKGRLCVAVASADSPEGPYVDHGPLVGQRMGSIDGFPMRDEYGVLYLIWKEDGNAYRKDTPIWAQRIDDKKMKLVGKKTELFRNDAPWEGTLVEGSAIIRHDDYFYMFYAGNGCCGKGCTYATGVARSRNLLGPWEKCPANPILTRNKTWTCPGHGTATEFEGRWFLLHHAYYTDSHEFVGRQGLLSEFSFNEEGWPEFADHTPQAPALQDVSVLNVADDFSGNQLALTWHWPAGPRPNVGVSDQQMLLGAHATRIGAMVAQRTYTATYKAVTSIDMSTLAPDTFGGMAAIGDPLNALALMATEGELQLWLEREGQRKVLAKVPLEHCKTLNLRLEVWGGQRYRFVYSTDDATTWRALPLDSFALNGTYLPPWDRGIRVGLLAYGPETSTVAFNKFAIRNQR